jgi:hypothetical protein
MIDVMNGLMRQVFNGNSHRRKEFKRSSGAIFTGIINFTDVTEVDQTLGASRTGHVGHEHKLFNKARAVAVDDSIFFGVKTAAVAGLIAIAAIGQTRGIAIVTDRQHLAKVRAGDDGPNVQTFAGGTPRQAESQIHINVFKTRTHHRNLRSVIPSSPLTYRATGYLSRSFRLTLFQAGRGHFPVIKREFFLADDLIVLMTFAGNQDAVTRLSPVNRMQDSAFTIDDRLMF